MTTLIKKKHTYSYSSGKVPVNLWKPKEGKDNVAACKALLKDNAYRAVKGDPIGSGNPINFLSCSFTVSFYVLQCNSAISAPMSFLQGVT